MTPTSHSKAIIKALTSVSASGHSYSNIFDDWLDLCVASMERLPEHIKATAAGLPMTDTPETEQLFQRIKSRYDNKDYILQAFAQAFASLMESVNDGYDDVIGQVYMEWNVSNKHAGQFFTPWNIAKCMAEMTMMDTEQLIHSRIKAAIEKSPAATAALFASICIQDKDEAWAWYVERVLPLAIEFYDPVTVMDCCCGSGVMFLAAASCLPQWMVQLGLVQFYGMDIDETCVKMARLNCYLYGLNGFGILCILDTPLSKKIPDQVPAPLAILYDKARTFQSLGDRSDSGQRSYPTNQIW